MDSKDAYGKAVWRRDGGQPVDFGALNRRNTNGGRGWITGDPRDALANGLTLYRLIEAGMTIRHESVQRAQGFLLATQQANGSWQVNSTKAVNKSEAIPTSVFWGTAWATIGLLMTLPNQELAGHSDP